MSLLSYVLSYLFSWPYVRLTLEHTISDQLVDTKLLLKELSFGWDERLEAQEMTSLAKICPRVKALRGVSNGIPNDFHIRLVMLHI